MVTYNIQFDGYWLDQNKGNIPHISGVYVVYRGVYNASLNNVELKEIIYIGQSEDVNVRLSSHDKMNEFMSTLKEGEILCYSCAKVAASELDIIENALIIAQSPRLNVKVENNIDFSNCQFVLRGQCALMNYTNFAVTSNR